MKAGIVKMKTLNCDDWFGARCRVCNSYTCRCPLQIRRHQIILLVALLALLIVIPLMLRAYSPQSGRLFGVTQVAQKGESK